VNRWKTAALLQDRTRRAIRDRVNAGESATSVAKDYGVPVTFVTTVAAWQLFEDRIDQWGEAAKATKED
jgi:hypothetical protein